MTLALGGADVAGLTAWGGETVAALGAGARVVGSAAAVVAGFSGTETAEGCGAGFSSGRALAAGSGAARDADPFATEIDRKSVV